MPPKAKEMEPEPSFPSEEFVGQILNCFSADFTRLDNVHLIDDFTVLTATGNLVLTIEIGTQKVGWIQGLDGGELNEDDNEEEEEEEEEEIIDLHTHDDQGPVPVNAVVRLPEKLGNSLIIAMQRAEGSYMVKLSPMGTFLLVGCEQGTVMLRDAIGNHGTPLKKAYHINLGHDGRQEVRQSGVCLPGTIQGLAMSYDESILLSVSEDGSFLSYSLSSEVADISDKQALSIQQTK
eukprot:gene15576-23775_t